MLHVINQCKRKYITQDAIGVPKSNRHKHADLMVAYANNTSLKIEQSLYGEDWYECKREPRFYMDYEYRIKQPKKMFRVAYLGDGHTYTAYNDSHIDIEKSPAFKGWLTYWREYE